LRFAERFLLRSVVTDSCGPRRCMIIDRTKSGSRFPIIIHFLFWHNSNTALYEILIAVELFCAWRPRHSIWLFVKSVNAESELVLVYNHGYILRFHLHQEKGINWCPGFPLSIDACSTVFSTKTHRKLGAAQLPQQAWRGSSAPEPKKRPRKSSTGLV